MLPNSSSMEGVAGDLTEVETGTGRKGVYLKKIGTPAARSLEIQPIRVRIVVGRIKAQTGYECGSARDLKGVSLCVSTMPYCVLAILVVSQMKGLARRKRRIDNYIYCDEFPIVYRLDSTVATYYCTWGYHKGEFSFLVVGNLNPPRTLVADPEARRQPVTVDFNSHHVKDKVVVIVSRRENEGIGVGGWRRGGNERAI